MPVSREHMKLYPGGSLRSKEWLAIRARIMSRAGHRCEGTMMFPECRAVHMDTHPETGSRVVLTIAHMDQDRTNNGDDNLRALCQRCHLAWDAPFKRENAELKRELNDPQKRLPLW